MNEPEIAEYLPYCTLQDVNSMIELLIAHDKKPVSGRSSQIYGMNAYEKIKKILNDMESGIVFHKTTLNRWTAILQALRLQSAPFCMEFTVRS